MDESEKPSALPWIAFVCKDAYEISKLFVREYRVGLNIISIKDDSSSEEEQSSQEESSSEEESPDEEGQSDEREEHLYGTTRIRFNPDLDTLFANCCGMTDDEEPYAGDYLLENVKYLQDLKNGPHALSMMPKVNVMLDMGTLVGPRGSSWAKWLTARPTSDCLAQHSHCTIMLANTVFWTTSTDIRSSELFGMFGEERNVLIDIKDTAKIDQYERYLDQLESVVGGCSDGWNYFPEDEPAHHTVAHIGAGRYGTEYGDLAESGRARTEAGEDSRALSRVHSRIAEEDGAMALYLIKQAWLEANHCFEPAEKPLLPWTGDGMFRKWDDNHHVAKRWLSKLPTFSFVVMYTVTERKGLVCTGD